MRKVASYLIGFVLAIACAITAQAQEAAFPYPAVPDSLDNPQERAAYVLAHYWEQYQFADTTAQNQAMGEQGFSDFLYVLTHADSLAASQAVEDFVRQTFATPWGEQHYAELISHYLYNPNSPLRDDRIYVHFLRAMLHHYEQGPPRASLNKRYIHEHEQARFLLRQVAKNQVGTIAADLTFSGPDGHQQHLHQIQSPLILIEFFETDCDNCKRIDAALADEPLIHSNPYLSLVRIPAANADGPYFIPSTPAFYLLDADKRVLLKDPPVSTLLQFLREIRSE